MTEVHPKKILVIEDEPHISEGLKLNLTLKGFLVTVAPDGPAGLSEWKSFGPHLIILDIMLPGLDGLSILQHIRLEDERIPILILSAKNTAADRIKGFKNGVDDYLTKPFHLDEFLLRVDRLLTRSEWQQDGMKKKKMQPLSEDAYRFGNNRIDFQNGNAACQVGEISLTEQEIRLLKLFISNRGAVLSRKQILEIGWGYAVGTCSRTVDNFVVRFRKYFEKDPKKPEYFVSKRSVGYVFDPDHE
ncbi:MAG: response regulator transcription factor [Candidatus Magnetomorum sp.]|nr:response regulator transcription factor [Candidatus Magnetomorum sp.]